jgi:hypothetical protein
VSPTHQKDMEAVLTLRRLYDEITTNAPEYYLFPDELNLLKTHGPAIARAMGFPGRAPLNAGHEEEQGNGDDEDDKKERKFENEHEEGPSKPWRPAKWGDAALGKYNNGVNGEEGLGGGQVRGWDIVELGAG